MSGFLLDIVYVLAAAVAAPLWIYRMIRHGRYRSDWRERLGGAPIRYGLQPIIWIHGVSLGEINAARTLVEDIHRVLPDFRVVITSTTETGMDAARKRFAPDHLVFRWPFDLSLCVRRALDRLRPDLVVLIEGELWPNFLDACRRRGIPTAVVNARLGADKGYPRYRLIRPLARKLMFSRVGAVGAQTQAYADRFVELGVLPERVRVTGMLKYDTAEVADRLEGQDALAAALGLSDADRLVVAGGTGPDEERILLDVYRTLRSRHPAVRLAIVPRKPERFAEVGRLIDSAGFACVRRSEHPDGAEPPNDADAVILGDTMGELRTFYALAACVFVGRSLVPMGGSDMIEAAALGKAAAFGPHTFNFPQAEELAAAGARRVADGEELTGVLDEWLDDPSAAADAGRRAQRFVIERQGATRRNVEMLCELLDRVPPVSEGGIAADRIRAPAAAGGAADGESS